MYNSPKKKLFSSGFVVGLFLCLVICLIAALTYYVLKDNGIDLFSTKTEETSTTGDNSSSSTDSTVCSDTGSSCKVALSNTGWSLFSLPDDDFSVEIPSYSMTQKIGSETVPSVWKVWHTETSDTSKYYDDYIHTVNIAFYPTYIPEGTGCGQGCVKEDFINLNIYKNTGEKDLGAVVNTYKSKYETIHEDDGTLTGSNVTKYDTTVWAYKNVMPGGSWNGYLVVTSDYVYDIYYYLSTSPSDAYQVAQKVLDSMKFEDKSPSSTASTNDVTVSVTYEGSASAISSDYSDMVYFQGSGDYDSTSRVYLIPASKVSLGTSQLGKSYSLTYDSLKTTSKGVAAGTNYLTIDGTFSYQSK